MAYKSNGYFFTERQAENRLFMIQIGFDKEKIYWFQLEYLRLELEFDKKKPSWR